MVKRVLVLPVLITLLIAAAGPVSAKSRGQVIEGFVGQSSTVPAPGLMVRLLDGTGQALAQDDTNFFGKYKFDGLLPGYYIVQVNNVRMEVRLEETDKKSGWTSTLASPPGP
jgi:hypothetical protein